ncbi:ArsR/SmtB family transcription factor [Synechococcus sp. W60.1]|uniref:ArsR/SmtB family transcription factor n=1 Tax=Synechococcus sp. W60.1 TaxID=2964516 RepID=UPI0039C40273
MLVSASNSWRNSIVPSCLVSKARRELGLFLCQLRSGPKNVTQILEATGMGQANVSKHLKILTQAGIVSRQPKGVSVYYQIADPMCFELCEMVCRQLVSRLQQQARQLEPLAAIHPGQPS